MHRFKNGELLAERVTFPSSSIVTAVILSYFQITVQNKPWFHYKYNFISEQ